MLDPFAGTGTTALTALQTQRDSISIEIDPVNIDCIKSRLKTIRDADLIQKYYQDYICTENLADIWGEDLYQDYNVQNNFLTLRRKNLELAFV